MTTTKRKSTKQRKLKAPKKPNNTYVALWRLVDAAVMDAFKQHPEYIAYNEEWIVRNSINKRVVGNIKRYMQGLAAEAAKGRTV